jgi:L-alanine-DL-glutamate epimerase-like enolase superfamily enzyme
MKITSVECLLLSCPYATPEDAERVIHLPTGYRTASIIRVRTDTGIEGLGETYAGVYAPEAVKALVDQFAMDLIGSNPMDVRARWNEMRLASYYWGRMGLTQSVIGGIEMALWDLKGKTLDVPVYELLGGRVHDSIPAYASGGNNKPFDELREELLGYLELGYRSVKIRINHLPDLSQIVKKTAFCREVLGADVGLSVDAAQGLAPKPWTVKEALEVSRALEDLNLMWIEEPAEVTNYAGFAEIRRNTRIPVAGGETVTSVTEAKAYLNAGALNLFQPDAGLIGGLDVFRQVAQLCARDFIPVAVHAWSGGVGLMGNYHAAFATPNCTILELPNVPNPLRDELLLDPVKLVDGKVAAPQVPGLGVKLTDAVIARYPYKPGSVYRTQGAR